MAERISNGYKRLFEIRLLHHYWLDEGRIVFDQILDKTKRYQRLLAYDRRSFLAIAPTPATAKALKGLGCIYKNTGLGCFVAMSNGGVIPLDTRFDFVVTVQSTAFFNYTALTLRSQKIYELYHRPEEKTYRYKENVSVLSNLTGAARDTKLFLSQDYAEFTVADQVESLGRSGTELLQLTGDQPGASTQQLGADINNLPVFVHQNDVPDLTPPTGLTGVPARGVKLSSDIADDIFALIQLSAVRPDNKDFSFTDQEGQAKTSPPIFQVRFKNRSTIWQYFNKDTRALISEEATPFPFTHFGNTSEKQKPDAALVKAVKSGAKITKLVSEIFVKPAA